jgi:hypothetical protein
MIDRTRCMAFLDPSVSHRRLCQAPATYESKLTGRLCAHHAEDQRALLRSGKYVFAGGTARTEEQIALLVRELPS